MRRHKKRMQRPSTGLIHYAWITPTGLADGFGHPSCPTWQTTSQDSPHFDRVPHFLTDFGDNVHMYVLIISWQEKLTSQSYHIPRLSQGIWAKHMRNTYDLSVRSYYTGITLTTHIKLTQFLSPVPSPSHCHWSRRQSPHSRSNSWINSLLCLPMHIEPRDSCSL